MPRFKILVGKHYHKVTLPDGSESTREFSAHDPTCDTVETDLDLEDRYNQPGFSEKFRRLPDAIDEIKAFNDDDFRKEAIRRGLIKDGDTLQAANHGTATMTPPKSAPSVHQEVHEAAKKGFATGQPHPALANLAKMPKVGLKQLAEDEEIDLSACKEDEGQMRASIKRALEARR